MKEKTYFGLSVHVNDEKYVLESDIQKLALYIFWKESSRGKTCLLLDNDSGIYLHDWENFCKYRLINNEKNITV